MSNDSTAVPSGGRRGTSGENTLNDSVNNLMIFIELICIRFIFLINLDRNVIDLKHLFRTYQKLHVDYLVVLVVNS